MRRLIGAAVLAALAGAAGCGEAGPQRFQVAGAASFAGRPIPYGEVLFTPDGAKKNSGPQGVAEIHDGHFDTRSRPDGGAAGGATVVRVTGMTGPGGKTLCVYETRIDLPSADTTRDIDVPREAAPKGPEPRPI